MIETQSTLSHCPEPLSADATFDDAPQSAADLLERISQGTDIAATPGHSDETTTTANNQWQEASTNAEDRPDTAGAAQVVPRRRRAQGVTASADYEFIEKSCKHNSTKRAKESSCRDSTRLLKTRYAILKMVETICDNLAK
ncbi:hypothetical protein MRX96_004588 [Rhipicephalus microplus]